MIPDWSQSRLVIALVAACVSAWIPVSGAFASYPAVQQDPSAPPAEASEEQPPEAAATAAPVADPVFPDPLLMKRARTYRNLGGVLSISGAVTFLASFNIALGIMRSGDPTWQDAMPYIMVPAAVVMVVALEIGAPLWSVGGEMYRQLTRNTKGDEKLRRPVANDARYWKGRTMDAFGTTMAISGGLEITVGLLTFVGGLWVVQQQEMLAEGGYTPKPWVIVVPLALMAAGTAQLIGGLELRKDGLERSRAVREAYELTQLFPVPWFEPGGGGGLALVGRF